MRTIKIIIITLILIAFSSSQLSAGLRMSVSESKVYTLYRNSVYDKNARIHIATFDADETEEYNKENAEIARDLFQNQPGVIVDYWSEKGYFKE